MQPQFVFPIHDLQQTGMRDVDAPLPVEWLADALRAAEVEPAPGVEGRITLRLVTSGSDVIVRGTLEAHLATECGRCLKPMTLDISTELALFLVPARQAAAAAHGKAAKPSKPRAAAKHDAKTDHAAPKKKGGKGSWSREDGEEVYEFAPDEADADTYTGDEVVLDGFIREAILLEIPIFPLCSEECPGIGPVPTAAVDAEQVDSPIDPRLAPLLALKKKS